jgi:hypothetical protein
MKPCDYYETPLCKILYFVGGMRETSSILKEDGDAEKSRKWLWCKGCFKHTPHLLSFILLNDTIFRTEFQIWGSTTTIIAFEFSFCCCSPLNQHSRQ